MGRKKVLTEFQLRIMEALWERGEATVSDVHNELKKVRPSARTTVATMMSRMENQGLIAHKKLDVVNLYYPLVRLPEIRKSMVSQLLDSLFEGDRTELVSHLLHEKDTDPEEIEKIARLIEELKAEKDYGD